MATITLVAASPSPPFRIATASEPIIFMHRIPEVITHRATGSIQCVTASLAGLIRCPMFKRWQMGGVSESHQIPNRRKRPISYLWLLTTSRTPGKDLLFCFEEKKVPPPVLRTGGGEVWQLRASLSPPYDAPHRSCTGGGEVWQLRRSPQPHFRSHRRRAQCCAKGRKKRMGHEVRGCGFQTGLPPVQDRWGPEGGKRE